jgi:hypothetical protein
LAAQCSGSRYSPLLLYVQHVAELAVLLKNGVDLLGAIIQCASHPEERQPPFGKIADNLLLEPFPLLVPAAIPGVGIGDVRVAEKKQIVPFLRFPRKPRQNRAGAAMVVLGKNIGGNRVRVAEKVFSALQRQSVLPAVVFRGAARARARVVLPVEGAPMKHTLVIRSAYTLGARYARPAK